MISLFLSRRNIEYCNRIIARWHCHNLLVPGCYHLICLMLRGNWKTKFPTVRDQNISLFIIQRFWVEEKRRSALFVLQKPLNKIEFKNANWQHKNATQNLATQMLCFTESSIGVNDKAHNDLMWKKMKLCINSPFIFFILCATIHVYCVLSATPSMYHNWKHV